MTCMDGEEGDRLTVWRRAVAQGSTIGAVLGVAAEGGLLLATQWPELSRNFLLIFAAILVIAVYAPIAAAFGGLVGCLFALVPSIVVALASGYFRRRPRLALFTPAALGLIEQIVVVTTDTDDIPDKLSVALVVCFGLGLALAMAATRYVLTGRGFRIRIGRRRRQPGFGLVSGLP